MPAAPSLLIVPYRSKTGKLYSQIPTSGAGDFTVTRDTTARRFTSAGLIASVASGIPRLDYLTSGGTAGCPALLVEPAATNSILQSTDSASGWTLSNSMTRATIDVIGVSGVNLTVGTSGSIGSTGSRYTSPLLTPALNLASGSTYTISFFLKKTTTHTIGGYYATIGGAAAGDLGGGFDVSGSFSSGSIYNSALTTNRIRRVERWGTDVFRCSETFTMTASGTIERINLGVLTAVNSTTVAPTGTTMGFAAPQLELGSVPTSFIPTTAGTGSRSADVVSVSGAVSGSIGQTQGTIYCEFAYFGQPVLRTGPIFLRSGAFRGFAIGLGLADVASTGIRFSSRNNTATINVPLVSGALQLGTYYKVAIGYDAGATPAGGAQASGVVTYVNGVQAGIGTLQVPDTAITEIRMYGANTTTEDEAFNGRIRAVALYNTRLTNAELAALTA